MDKTINLSISKEEKSTILDCLYSEMFEEEKHLEKTLISLLDHAKNNLLSFFKEEGSDYHRWAEDIRERFNNRTEDEKEELLKRLHEEYEHSIKSVIEKKTKISEIRTLIHKINCEG